MDQTAVKVPGKRTRGTTKADVAARKKLNRPPGRPLKLPPSEAPSDTSARSTKGRKKSKMPSLKNIKSKHDMSPLERLPTELLVEVFLYCMNLNLPRSSPVIGGKLSSESVYTRTILAAFEDTWEEYYKSRKDTPSNRIQGDYKLQSAVLRCRWATLSLFLQSQDICMRRRNAQRVVLEPILWFAEGETNERKLEDVVLSSKTVTERFDEDYTAFLCGVGGPEHAYLHQTCNVNCCSGVTDLAEGTEIPHSLLLGPWTNGMIRYLYWLVKSGVTLNWLTSTSGEIALLGFQNALGAGQIPVIHLLMWAGLSEKLDITMLMWALHNVKGNKVAIMSYLLAQADLKDADEHKFKCELAAERGDAQRKFDQEKLAFLDAIRGTLETYELDT